MSEQIYKVQFVGECDEFYFHELVNARTFVWDAFTDYIEDSLKAGEISDEVVQEMLVQGSEDLEHDDWIDGFATIYSIGFED